MIGLLLGGPHVALSHSYNRYPAARLRHIRHSGGHHDDNDGDTGHQLTFFASMEMNSVFEGSVNVRAVLADRAGALPATGGGGSHSSLRWVALASGIVLLTGAAISWAGARGRRRS